MFPDHRSSLKVTDPEFVELFDGVRRACGSGTGSARPSGTGPSPDDRWLLRQRCRLPESLPADTEAFVSSLRTHQDRATVVAMLLGGLRDLLATDFAMMSQAADGRGSHTETIRAVEPY